MSTRVSAGRVAVIDAGTNSIKFLVAERDSTGGWRPIVDRAEMTRLGEGVHASGEISPAALERTTAAIEGMVGEAREHGATAIAAVGTAGLRIARNRQAVVATIRERTGVTIEVIPGEEEARLAFLAATTDGRPADDAFLAVFDTGGGSTQLTFGHGTVVDERFSLDVGAVRYTERFGLAGVVAADVLGEARAAIAADMRRLDGRPPVDALVGMGGAVTNIASVMHGAASYDPDAVDGTVLGRAELDRQIELYRTSGLEARRSIPGLQPRRADVILAGVCIVRTLVDKLDQSSLVVSDRGVRHGVLIDRFGATPRVPTSP